MAMAMKMKITMARRAAGKCRIAQCWTQSLQHPIARHSSSSSDPVDAIVKQYSWRTSLLVDGSRCTDAGVGDGDLLVMPDVITEEEELVLADECMRILKRRRYEEDHWDQVIVKFKEMERSRWSSETRAILAKMREVPILPKDLDYFPAVHVIDLAEDGYIRPHVDSIKFSGRVVAGVSLLSPSIMRFKEEHGDSIVDAYLPRRSMYMMTDRIRYHYTHEILPGVQTFKNDVQVNRTRRISVMMRDVFVELPSSILGSNEAAA